MKKRREAIVEAEKLARADIVATEQAEAKVLEQFLPKQLTEAEMVVLVESVIKETGATSKKDQGKVMSALMPKLQGRGDGKLVAKLVGDRLA